MPDGGSDTFVSSHALATKVLTMVQVATSPGESATLAGPEVPPRHDQLDAVYPSGPPDSERV